MAPEIVAVDQRLARLQTPIDRVDGTLTTWREAQDHLPPLETRLSRLSEQCADVLKQWAANGERHAHAVGELEARLSGWNDIEARLQRDATFRFHALERVIEQEWASLRTIHEEPARQLRAQAESLTEICITTAGSAQTGIEQAEARLARLETDLHRRMGELSHELHAAVAELAHRTDSPVARRPAAPWSLDEVTRLHEEIRGASGASPTFGAAL